MRTICSVLRTVANYLMWRDMRARVMSAISLCSGGWLTGVIWLVRSLLRDRHPDIMLVLTSLFVRHWCLLQCDPAFRIHFPDRLLVPTVIFSTPLLWIFWEGHAPYDVGCIMLFLMSRIENASSCDEYLCGAWLCNHPCWCYPVASNAKIVAGIHGSVTSGNTCPWIWSCVGRWCCWWLPVPWCCWFALAWEFVGVP